MSTRDDYITHDFINDGPARELLDRLEAAREASLASSRAAGAAEERARGVAVLRDKSRWHYEQARKLGQVEHSAAALALEEMADRIDRGEA